MGDWQQVTQTKFVLLYGGGIYPVPFSVWNDHWNVAVPSAPPSDGFCEMTSKITFLHHGFSDHGQKKQCWASHMCLPAECPRLVASWSLSPCSLSPCPLSFELTMSASWNAELKSRGKICEENETAAQYHPTSVFYVSFIKVWESFIVCIGAGYESLT